MVKAWPDGGEVHALVPMRWWESVRVAGWRGGLLADKPIAVSVDAIKRGIKGQRRQQAARKHVNKWHEGLRGRHRVNVSELAQLLAHPEKADGRSVQRFIFVDIELDATDSIRQIGLAVEVDDRLVLAEGTSADLHEVSTVLSGQILVAHNGATHDFPRLVAAGVRLPNVCVDSMRWSWVGWPTADSHALGALVERHVREPFDAAHLHDAVVDAQAIALLWPTILTKLGTIGAAQRALLRAALVGVESDVVLDLMFGRLPGLAAPIHTPRWEVDAGVSPTGNRVRDRSGKLSDREGAVKVVPSLIAAISALPTAGMLLRPSQVLDSSRVQSLAPGWAKAIAIRVIETARGAIPLAPPSARSLLVGLGRSGDQALRLSGTPIITDLATVTLMRVRRPITIEVGIAQLFESVGTGVTIIESPSATQGRFAFTTISDLGSRDRDEVSRQLRSRAPAELQALATTTPIPGGLLRLDNGESLWMVDALDVGCHAHGADLVLDSPVGGDRSRALWRRLLGDEVEIDGQGSRWAKWDTIDGLVPASARHPGRRTAQLLGVAAGYESSGRITVVVDSQLQRDAVERAAARMWRDKMNAPLLRPPSWPTIDESQRRLQSGVARSVLVGPAGARALAPFADKVIFARTPVPSLQHPTVRRMVGEGLDDPFTEIIEPLSAHIAADLISVSAEGRVVIADPHLGTGVLVELVGRPNRRHLTEYPSNAPMVSELIAHLLNSAERIELNRRALTTAKSRLLPPGAVLKAFQEVVINDVADGKDVIGVFRTGLGKSLCYQVPALALAASDGVTIVVSPLIALQRDQLRGLQRKGVAEAVAFNSSLTPQVRAGVLRGVKAGFYRVLFVSPEALSGHALRRILQDVDLALIAIDEAHCISEMGHDFRPDYRTLPRAIARLLGLPDDMPLPEADLRPTIVALTGTASPQVIDDIRELLG